MRSRFAYQDEAFWAVFPGKRRRVLRRYYMSWMRQGRKTTTLAGQKFKEMMDTPGRTVLFASANLNLGGEMVEKQAGTWVDLYAGLRAEAEAGSLALRAGVMGHEVEALNWADLAEALEKSKFELRLYHSNSVVSRTKIIAADVRTARGWSGSVCLDEAPFVEDLETLLEELEPMYSTDPTFTFVMSGTPPKDYAHYGYELMAAEDGREEWPVNARGNWYRNRLGFWVHRVTIDDAAAAGRKNFHPDTGAELSPDEYREVSVNKEGWDRSNRLKRPEVGTSAVNPLDLDACFDLGRGKGLVVEGELSDDLLRQVIGMLGKGKISCGLDLASSDGGKSNPSSLTVAEKVGNQLVVRLAWHWKTARGEVTLGNVERVIDALLAAGARLIGLGIDASNETLFARQIKRALALKCRVALIKGGEKMQFRGEEDNAKTILGHVLANTVEAHGIALPPSEYVRKDWMRINKKGGEFVCTVGPNGEHGDTFDSTKLAVWLQVGRGGPAEARGAAVGEVAAAAQPARSGLSRLGRRAWELMTRGKTGGVR